MNYPPTVSDLQARLGRSLLSARTVEELTHALGQARARVEQVAPYLRQGTAPAEVKARGARLVVEWAVYYLREEVEVDENGDLPLRLRRLRERLESDTAEFGRLAVPPQAFRAWLQERVDETGHTG